MLREKVSCGIRFADDVPGVVKFHSCGKRCDDSSRGGGKSFTLIELLVVIVIIAILASMLMPALNQARKAGQGASCQSNLKQQGLAIFAYADDYNGHYPALYDDGNPRYHAVPLNPYMGSKGTSTKEKEETHFNPRCGYYGSLAFYCPGRNNVNRMARYVDYGAWHGQWDPKFDEMKIFLLKKPSLSLLRLESQNDIGSPIGEGNISALKHIATPHLDKSNSLYFDGHVAAFTKKNMTEQQVKECMKIE